MIPRISGRSQRSLADAEIAAEFTGNAKRMLPDEAAMARLRASIDDLVAGADTTEVVAQNLECRLDSRGSSLPTTGFTLINDANSFVYISRIHTGRFK